MDEEFLVRADELTLRYRTPAAPRRLSFERAGLPFERWRPRARTRLAELLGVGQPLPAEVSRLRSTVDGDVEVTALVMRVDASLSLPAYLLRPAGRQGSRPAGRAAPTAAAVLALHGHGQIDECVGVREDYHHAFALVAARAGHTVLLPELRGFGALRDLARHRPGAGLDYWRWGEHMTYPLVTDGFQHGRTLLGDTIEDLLRWEHWLAATHDVRRVDVAGISWGGDLACSYPVFSSRVRSIFASGTLGSFAAVFDRCGNAPAHCVPGVLTWLDRPDITGLNAPRPIALHYGALDVPGPGNGSASYNETVPDALAKLRAIYRAAGAPDAVSLLVSPDTGHEMDNVLLLQFLRDQAIRGARATRATRP